MAVCGRITGGYGRRYILKYFRKEVFVFLQLPKEFNYYFCSHLQRNMITARAFVQQTNRSSELCAALNLNGWGLSSVAIPDLFQDGAIDTVYVLIPVPSFPQSVVCSLLPLVPQGAAQGSFAVVSL